MSNNKGCKRIAISREWILRLLKCIDGLHCREIIPDDAEIIDASYVLDQKCFILTVESDSYNSFNDETTLIPFSKFYRG